MLYPCERCHRYIRNDEANCPFCDAVVAPLEVTGEAPSGLSRREMFALAAAAVAGSVPLSHYASAYFSVVT